MPPRKAKYPGRDRVIARGDALSYRFDQLSRGLPRNICEAPRTISAIGLPGYLDADKAPASVEMMARCRKCGPCLEHRRQLWAARGRAEILCSARTWFVTLTFDPEQRFRIKHLADLKASRRRCEPWSALSAHEQFRALAEQASREVTLWLKRIRKQCGSFRYLLVAEAHADGFPHFHLLLHEPINRHGILTKRALQAQWRAGFSHCKLVSDPRAVSYVSKYLSKDARTRVRASQHYGQAAESRLLAEALEGLVTDARAEGMRKEVSLKGQGRPLES